MDFNELYQLLNADGSQDARLKVLAQLMAEQNKEKVTPEDSRLKDYEKVSQHLQLLGHHIKKLKKANRILLQNLALMIARNDELAEALGACHDCFGKDPSCSHCRGLGKPGYYEINLNMFAAYIQPCLEQLSSEVGPTSVPNQSQHQQTI